jgi:hypothetical protein
MIYKVSPDKLSIHHGPWFALALIRHFGSLKALSRASFQELRQFLPRRQAESVVAALSMSVIAETEHARSEQLDIFGGM